MRVLVAVCKSDLDEGRGTPLIVGCIDEVIWEHCDDETLEGIWGPLKQRVDPGGGYYEYREVSVSLDAAAVLSAFATPEIPGIVLVNP